MCSLSITSLDSTVKASGRNAEYRVRIQDLLSIETTEKSELGRSTQLQTKCTSIGLLGRCVLNSIQSAQKVNFYNNKQLFVTHTYTLAEGDTVSLVLGTSPQNQQNKVTSQSSGTRFFSEEAIDPPPFMLWIFTFLIIDPSVHEEGYIHSPHHR